MANALFDLGKQKLLEGSIAWLTDNIRCILLDGADYTPNLVTDEFLSDVLAIPAAEIDRSGNFTTKTSTLGVADADDITFLSVTGDQAELIVIFKFVTNDADSPVIALIDTATGLPVTPDGNNINILWDSGANKIFAI